ncbi:MAG: phosphotransferase, partial [Paracoccaceae bacterium]
GAHNFYRGGDLRVYDAEAREAIAALAGRLDAGRAVAVWERALASAWQGAPVWVHGDVAAGNLLLRDGELAAVIDFGGLAVGDPACDLVGAWTMFDGAARLAFREEVGVDAGTWDRARGWALWKAVIVAAGVRGDAGDVARAWEVIEAVLEA